MLLAVEGGGLFSSSASGYSKGLTLLLLGQKTEDKPMRVAPWNHYQLVEKQETDTQLASCKKGLVRGCATFSCFGRASTGLDSPSSLRVGLNKDQEILPQPQSFDAIKDQSHSVVDPNVVDGNKKIVGVKSSLKKPRNGVPVDNINGSRNEVETIDCNMKAVCVSRRPNELESLNSVSVLDNVERGAKGFEDGTTCEKDHCKVSCQVGRRKVQWMDAIGGELIETREFEMSEDDSDNEFNHGNGKTCLCRIM